MQASDGASTSYKDQGNEAYRQGSFLKAAALYTKGLKEEPGNAVLYSNRSAALLQISKLAKALGDADECVRLRPDWDKGHFRRGAALEALGRVEEALPAYKEAAALGPDDRQVAEKVRHLSKVVLRKAKPAGAQQDQQRGEQQRQQQSGERQ